MIESPALLLFQSLLDVSDYRVREVVGETIEFDNVFHGAQPGQLAFCQLPRGGDPLFAQGGEADFAVEIGPGLAVADTAHRRHIDLKRIIFAQRAQFRDQAQFEHRFEAFGNAQMQD